MRALFIFITSLVGLSASVSYEGYKVYNVVPETEGQIQTLKLLESDANFDFWSKLNRAGKPVAIMAAPKIQRAFEKYLWANNISHSIQIEDVESTIQAEREYHKLPQASIGGRIALDQYHRHEEINDYLEQLAEVHPDIVTVETIGQSYEGRDLKLVRISTPTVGPRAKPIIFVDAGIHAREWIAPALALYIISQLVENEANRNLITNVDWIVYPSVNPDGYEYTWDVNRLWRKTRSPGTRCDGVDGERNFDFHWMELGASGDECSDIYAGPKPLSEVESQALSKFLLSTKNIALFVGLHSYGPYIIYPWSYTYDLPENWEELQQLGDAANDAIRAVSGTSYTVGNSMDLLYAAAGCSDDYAKGPAGIPLVYVIELPGGGSSGFDLPASRILGVSQETWEGFKVFHDHVAANY